VAELAAEAGYDETMALGDVLQIITLNANGLANPFINGLAVLQLMTPAELNALRNSKDKREALSWELMRFNGPRSAQIAPADVAIPDGAKTYLVKKGTRIMGILGLAQLDPSVYPEPYVFDPTRFATADPYLSRPTWSKQPLPTMGQGLKFGGLADDKACSAKCVCPFVKLTQPLICAFIEMLLFDFDFVLANFGRNDAAANDEESVVPRSSLLLGNGKFDFSPKNLAKTAGASDFTLAGPDKGAFHFHYFALKADAAASAAHAKAAAAQKPKKHGFISRVFRSSNTQMR